MGYLERWFGRFGFWVIGGDTWIWVGKTMWDVGKVGVSGVKWGGFYVNGYRSGICCGNSIWFWGVCHEWKGVGIALENGFGLKNAEGD